MLIDRLISNPCTIVRRTDSGDTDEFGNPITTEASTDTLCELQQVQRRTSQEPGDQGELSDTLWDLYLPAGTEIATADSVTVDGQAYELVGGSWHVRHPLTGRETHMQATVRRTA